MELLRKLMFASSVSGREERVCNLIKEEITPYCDEITVDNMGNLIAHKKGNGKKVMFCAHMDEIGFFVTYIEENGLIKVSPVGGINFLSASYCDVVSEKGVFGVMVPSSNDSIPKGEDVSIDIGAKTKKQAERVVSVGDFFVCAPKIRKLRGTRMVGRPFDDRVGCYILIETLKNVKNTENDLYFVFSTQEEVGLRGSKVATFGVEPDIGIAIDVTRTGDKPTDSPMCVELGAGPTIKIKDSSVICSPEIVKKMKEIGARGGIKTQDEVLVRGGTDTASMQITKCGAKVGAISIPSAFIHSQNEMIDMADVEEAIKFATLICEQI